MVETPIGSAEGGAFVPPPASGTFPSASELPSRPGTGAETPMLNARAKSGEDSGDRSGGDGGAGREVRAGRESAQGQTTPSSRIDSGIKSGTHSDTHSGITSLWEDGDRHAPLRSWDDASDPFDQVVPILSPEALFNLPLNGEGASVLNNAGRDFRAALEQAPDTTLGLPSLASQLNAHLDASLEEASLLRSMQLSPTGQSLQFEFSMELPGMGPLTGRMLIGKGKAELELQAHRPATAAALRAQAQQLRQLVQKDSDGDVELWVL